MSNLDSDPLTSDPNLFSAKKSKNSAKSNRIFVFFCLLEYNLW